MTTSCDWISGRRSRSIESRELRRSLSVRGDEGDDHGQCGGYLPRDGVHPIRQCINMPGVMRMNAERKGVNANARQGGQRDREKLSSAFS